MLRRSPVGVQYQVKIVEITHRAKKDFDGVLRCEYCGNVESFYGEPDDLHFREIVVPVIECIKCRKKAAISA